MDDARRTEMRRAFAGMIAQFRRARLFDSSLLRTLMDSWHAYERGGHFIKDTGNPRTFNKPTAPLEFNALRQLPDCSKAARAVLEGRSSERIVKDHTIPVAHLRDAIMKGLPDDPALEEVEDWLGRNYRVAALTHAEHEALEHRDRMPADWDGSDPLARYRGIAMWCDDRDELPRPI